jgi:hypothetical protein
MKNKLSQLQRKRLVMMRRCIGVKLVFRTGSAQVLYKL